MNISNCSGENVYTLLITFILCDPVKATHRQPQLSCAKIGTWWGQKKYKLLNHIIIQRELYIAEGILATSASYTGHCTKYTVHCTLKHDN